MRFRVRVWAVHVPIHITRTTLVPFPYGCTHTKLKPAHHREPPFTTPVDRLAVCVEAGMGSRSLKARLLLTEVKSPVLGRASTPPHHQYKPCALSLRLYSHKAQAGSPSRALFHHPVEHLKVCAEAAMSSHSLKASLLLTEVRSPVLSRLSITSHH